MAGLGAFSIVVGIVWFTYGLLRHDQRHMAIGAAIIMLLGFGVLLLGALMDLLGSVTKKVGDYAAGKPATEHVRDLASFIRFVEAEFNSAGTPVAVPPTQPPTENRKRFDEARDNVELQIAWETEGVFDPVRREERLKQCRDKLVEESIGDQSLTAAQIRERIERIDELYKQELTAGRTEKKDFEIFEN